MGNKLLVSQNSTHPSDIIASNGQLLSIVKRGNKR